MKNNKKILKFYLLIFLLILPIIVSAQSTTAIDVKAIIERFLNFVVWPIFAGASILSFIWAGFLYLTAQGEPSKISQATKAVIWGSLGITIGLVGFSAIELVKAILGIP